jgi:hypothetical protein
MKFQLVPYGENEFIIVHEDCDCQIGGVSLWDGKYCVYFQDDWDEFAVVNSIDEVIHAFAAHYAKHPPRWQPIDNSGRAIRRQAGRNATRYRKNAEFGDLHVIQEQPGRWIAYRNSDHFPLLHYGRPASFSTLKEAQHVADTHMRQGYPNSPKFDDGYAWAVDRGIEQYFAARGRWPTPINAVA